MSLWMKVLWRRKRRTFNVVYVSSENEGPKEVVIVHCAYKSHSVRLQTQRIPQATNVATRAISTRDTTGSYYAYTPGSWLR
jgi:hypothetical protein